AWPSTSFAYVFYSITNYNKKAKHFSNSLTLLRQNLDKYYMTKYDKKNKEWYGRANPLMMYDKEQHTLREMTEEELEKYHIMWVPEDDFLY
ncbi:MAG: hypothetical protein QQN40_07570, partial [Nitrosopumilus sp.]